MTGCGLHAFDGALQEANLWLKGVMTRLDTPDSALALAALRGTLHALRDRIGPESAAQLGAQLPTLVRGLYYEGWHPDRTPSRERHKPAFVERLLREVPSCLVLDGEAAARAVCFVIWERLDPGAVVKLIRLLPAELHDLWPERARERALEHA